MKDKTKDIESGPKHDMLGKSEVNIHRQYLAFLNGFADNRLQNWLRVPPNLENNSIQAYAYTRTYHGKPGSSTCDQRRLYVGNATYLGVKFVPRAEKRILLYIYKSDQVYVEYTQLKRAL